MTMNMIMYSQVQQRKAHTGYWAGNEHCHFMLAPHDAGAHMSNQREPFLQAVMVLLGSKVPIVRNYTAERLYVALLLLRTRAKSNPGTTPWSSATLEAVQEMLCSINWATVDGVEGVKATRDRILGSLHVSPPVRKTPRKVKAEAPRDTETSYETLVNDFARGM